MNCAQNFHIEILREISVLIAIDAVVLILAIVGIRAFVLVCERHCATLTVG